MLIAKKDQKLAIAIIKVNTQPASTSAAILTLRQGGRRRSECDESLHSLSPEPRPHHVLQGGTCGVVINHPVIRKIVSVMATSMENRHGCTI